jgi:hypothetical protein
MNYNVNIIGDGKGGKFEGDIALTQSFSSGSTYHLVGVLDSLQTLFYNVLYTTDSTISATATKVINGSVLRQDLDNCPKFGLITQTLLYQTLSTQLNNYDAHIAIPDSVNAARDIRSFKHILDSVKTDTTKITSDGYWILNEDDSLLIAQLPVPPPQYTLTLTSGANGTATRNPNKTLYDSGSTVTLTATGNLGYKFSNWSGDASGSTNPLAVTMTGNKAITANFVIDHQLTVPAKFSTIRAAIAFARFWDTISVSPGTYNEYDTLDTKDTLTIMGVGGVDQAAMKGFDILNCTALTIKGLIIDASASGYPGILFEGAANGGKDSNVTIENNIIKNSSGNGVTIFDQNKRIRIANNRIYGNALDGISLSVSELLTNLGPVYIINNTIVSNGGNGVSSYMDYISYLVNNIISFNGTGTGGGYGIIKYCNSGGNAPIRMTPTPGCNPQSMRLLNNWITKNHGVVKQYCSIDLGNTNGILDGYDSGNLTTGGTEGSGVSIAPSAPNFTDIFVSQSPMDLHLKSNSPPCNRGLNSWSPPDGAIGAIPSTDFEGTTRPLGTYVDMGADEKQ